MNIYDLDHLESIDQNTVLLLNGGVVAVATSSSTSVATKNGSFANNFSYAYAFGGNTYTSIFGFLNTRPQGSGYQASAGSIVTAIATK